MKLLSFRVGGETHVGAVVGDGVVDVTRRLGSGSGSLRAILTAGALPAVGRALEAASADLPLAGLRFAPTIPDPDKILCVGLNYTSHVAEMSREMPKQPSVFARLHNTLSAHEAVMRRPKISTDFDFEGELAVVIGKRGRYIAADDALAHVAGYSIFNDGSVRDFQKHSVTAGKNFPGSGPLGPWMVTADEIPDPTALTLTTRLNGQVVQHSPTNRLIYSIPTIVAYLSSFTELLPGDVIATGTPDGVGAGRKPPLWMKHGDTIEVEISSIGVLRNRVEDE